MNVQIRKATIHDIEEITKLRLELLESVGDVHENNRKEVQQANVKYFEHKLKSEQFIAWVAVVENEVIGISGLVFFERPPHGENISGLEAYIMNMYTKPAFRGNGIAQALLNECISYCQSIGVGRIWLHTSKEGYPLYKKMGFVEKDSEMELIL